MEAKRMVAVLPAGRYFDELHAAILAPWAQSRGAQMHRLDLSAGSIGAVAPALENTELVLADISGRNSRVMYLSGYAHGIGKRVVFISQFEEDFPFEPGQQKVLVYSGSAEFLRKELDALDSESDLKAGGGDDARSRFLAVFGEIMRKHRKEHRGAFEMEGPGVFVLRDQDLDLALVQELSRRARELGLRIKLM